MSLAPKWDHEDLRWVDGPEPEVESTPNPVVARLVGADGAPLVDVYERPVVRLGFQGGDRRSSRVVRHR